MWTGENSLRSIKTFLDGYSLALSEHKIIESEENSEPNFHDWVADRLGFGSSTAGWHNMILAYAMDLDPLNVGWDSYYNNATDNQHTESIKMFYQLYWEYISC